MHHALEIEEILAVIFRYCCPPGTSPSYRGLAALARTCRAFTEPALDLLWEDLDDLSPLFYHLRGTLRRLPLRNKCSFVRPPTETEWDNLRSYTRRVRSIKGVVITLNKKSFGTFLNPPTTEPLFPNLRSLYCEYTTQVIPLLQLPLPSLISLEITCRNTSLIREDLHSLPDLSPNIKSLSIRVYRQEDMIDHELIPNYLCQWKNLQTLTLSQEIVLDVDSLVLLSRIPSLARLDFSLNNTLPAGSHLYFPYLRDLTLHSKSLAPLSTLLSQTLLPVITNFSVLTDRCKYGQGLASFFSSVQETTTTHTIKTLSLSSWAHCYRWDISQLVLDDLRPCMAFNDLRRMYINIPWSVSITDGDLLTLASAWPHLEELSINPHWGWKTPGGITPNGLLRLLQTCRSLSQIALAIDTRDVSNIPLPPEGFGLTLPRMFTISVVDSQIEPEAMSAMASFFAGIAPCPDSQTPFATWTTSNIAGWEEEWGERWEEVFELAHDVVSRRS